MKLRILNEISGGVAYGADSPIYTRWSLRHPKLAAALSAVVGGGIGAIAGTGLANSTKIGSIAHAIISNISHGLTNTFDPTNNIIIGGALGALLTGGYTALYNYFMKKGMEEDEATNRVMLAQEVIKQLKDQNMTLQSTKPQQSPQSSEQLPQQ